MILLLLADPISIISILHYNYFLGKKAKLLIKLIYFKLFYR